MKEEKVQESLKTEVKEAAMDFNTGLGIRYIQIEPGYAKAEMNVLTCHLNVLGGVHGGCLFTLADTTMGASIAAYGSHVTTVNSSINFLKKAQNTSKLIAEAKIVKHGRTFSVSDGKIFDDKGNLLATTTMTFFHLTGERAEQPAVSQSDHLTGC